MNALLRTCVFSLTTVVGGYQILRLFHIEQPEATAIVLFLHLVLTGWGTVGYCLLPADRRPLFPVLGSCRMCLVGGFGICSATTTLMTVEVARVQMSMIGLSILLGIMIHWIFLERFMAFTRYTRWKTETRLAVGITVSVGCMGSMIFDQYWPGLIASLPFLLIIFVDWHTQPDRVAVMVRELEETSLGSYDE